MAEKPIYVTGADGTPVRVSTGVGYNQDTEENTPSRPIYDFGSRPDAPLWSSFVVGGDPNYVDNSVADLETAGLKSAWQGATYGGQSYGAAKDIWDVGSGYAAGMQDTAGAGAAAMENVGANAAIDARNNANVLRDTSMKRLDSGYSQGRDFTALGGSLSSELGGLESGGYGTPAMDQLNSAKQRSLSAQQALAGTVRGIGPRQNTAMEDALISSSAGRNAEILRAREEAAFRDRRSQALLGAGQYATAGALGAENARQEALASSGNMYASAGDVAMRGEQLNQNANQNAAQYGLAGYGAASDVMTGAGSAAASGVNQAGDIFQQGTGAMIGAGGRATSKRDIEQRAGMGQEDYLTKKYAGALGVSSDAAAAAAKKEAAIYSAAGDGVSTYFSYAGRDK
jgi:hypothetical protein